MSDDTFPPISFIPEELAAGASELHAFYAKLDSVS